MRVFQTVLVDIQPRLQEVLAEAKHDEKIVEMMELLRILQFWPKCFDQYTVKTALETVNQEIMWDTMGWLLTRREELKKRAYLSQFLVKVVVPDEYLFDSDMQQCYEEYEAKITEFKAMHKKFEEMKKSKGVNVLVSDLKSVEHEIDSCSRKLDMMKCNVGEIPEKEENLQLAAQLRLARNETNRLKSQSYVEERKLWVLEKKCYFLSNKVRELQDLNSHSSPEGLLERIEQDCEILKFIVHQKIPNDIEETKRKIRAMKLVLSASPEFASDLEPTRMRILEIQKDIQSIEMEMKSKDHDASLSFARQKANQNKKRKMELLEDLEELRKDMLEHQNTLREKREQRKRLFPDGVPCLSSRDYKEYVKTMKVKAARYKAMRAEISTIQTEMGILSTTKFLVENKFKESIETLKELEAQLGLVGFSCVHERVEQTGIHQDDERKMRYIYEMSEKARELQERVKAKKADVEPLSRGVIAAKQEIKTLELQGKSKSNEYEDIIGPIMESNRRFETRNNEIKEDIIKYQEEMCRLTAEVPKMKANMQRAQAEAELLKVNPTSSRSFRNKILTRIVDQERLQKVLNLEMSQLEQTQAKDTKQSEMWTNLLRFLELKKSLQRNGRNTHESIYESFGQDS
ncbi:Intraflagellar transport protein 81 [Orchesella cincta]|uniref:Intraflagellar transport protein 81 n=1 Tax=Orchesella cincta TaxID=48709 RepID=A0A1D2NGE7_ORCCI|nr:Intraflagellar transport protein 81 [Orchesella cincta]